LKIISWNVNGYRSVLQKGFAEWFHTSQADVVCLQETRVLPNQLKVEDYDFAGYESHWNPASKKGYSGVATWSKRTANQIIYGMGNPEFDDEGRLVTLDFGSFVLINGYYPNGGSGPERLEFKMRFYDAFLQWIKNWRAQGKGVIFCGDLNTAHTEIDIARPKENKNVSGFLPEERAWMDQLVAAGWVDAFRHLHGPKPDLYTWWSNRANSRARNVGWRIDYFFVSEDMLPFIRNAEILAHVMGSDHCPITLELEGL
jgi:exodeoxyribonuclease-3